MLIIIYKAFLIYNFGQIVNIHLFGIIKFYTLTLKMRKITAQFAALALVASAAFMTGCSKDVENSVKPTTGKATVKGRVTADLNQTNFTEEPVTNTKVYVFVDTRDFAQNPGDGNFPKKRFEATTDANGDFSMDIDVPLNGTDIEITVPGFIYNVVTDDKGSTRRTTFGETTVNAGEAKDGSVLVQDISL